MFYNKTYRKSCERTKMVADLEQRRNKINAYLFIVLYAIMGIISGAAFDTMVTYLDIFESTRRVAESMGIIQGIGFVGGASMVLLVPKIGYKKTLFLGTIVLVLGLYLVMHVSYFFIVFTCVSVVLIGISLFDAILPPFLSCYINAEGRPKIFSTALWTNILGMVIGTFMGGKFIIYYFSHKLKISYDAALQLSTNVKGFDAAKLHAYALAHQDVLMIYVIITAVGILPILFLRENKSDYQDVEKKEEKMDYKALVNKYTIMFLLVVFLIRAGACLITPYFPIFLSHMGIDRGTTSALISYQYLANVIFIACSPFIIKRLGRVVTFAGLSLVSIPFMMVIANGAYFGAHKVLAVGLGLFCRSGFMNAGQPVQQSLPMEFVPKFARPAYNSLLFIVQGSAQFIAGTLAIYFLFSHEGGYTLAYYVTAIIYFLASILLLIVFTKKYNKARHEV